MKGQHHEDRAIITRPQTPGVVMSRCRHPATQGLAASQAASFIAWVLACAGAWIPWTQAQAQAETSSQTSSVYALYGTLDMAVGSFQPAGGARVHQVQSGTMQTSFIGLKAEESLDSGAKVLFRLEGFLRPDTGESGRWSSAPSDGAWSRAAHVGLAGSFGTVLLGRVPNLMFTTSRAFNTFSAHLGDAPSLSLAWSDPRGTAAQIEGDTAWSNALSYQGLPQDAWTWAAQVAAPEGDGRRNLGLSMNYAASPTFRFLAAWQEVRVGLGSGQEHSRHFGLSYDAGPVQLDAQATQIDDQAQATQTRVIDLSLSVPISSPSFSSSFSTSTKLLGAWNRSNLDPVAGPTDQVSVWRLGLVRDLSARTRLYGLVQEEQRTDLSPGRSVAFGLREVF